MISVPNLAAWHNIFSLLWGWQPFPVTISDEIVLGNPLNYAYKMSPAGGKYSLHFRIPTFRGLKELLEYHGFEIERIVGSSYYPFWGKASRFLYRIDPRHSGYLIVKAKEEMRHKNTISCCHN